MPPCPPEVYAYVSASRLCGDITELADMSADDLVDLHMYIDELCRIYSTSTVPSSKCAEELSQLHVGSTPIVLQHAGVQERLNAACRYRRTRSDVDRSNWLTIKVEDNAFGLRKEKRRILAERDHSE